VVVAYYPHYPRIALSTLTRSWPAVLGCDHVSAQPKLLLLCPGWLAGLVAKDDDANFTYLHYRNGLSHCSTVFKLIQSNWFRKSNQVPARRAPPRFLQPLHIKHSLSWR